MTSGKLMDEKVRTKFYRATTHKHCMYSRSRQTAIFHRNKLQVLAYNTGSTCIDKELTMAYLAVVTRTNKLIKLSCIVLKFYK